MISVIRKASYWNQELRDELRSFLEAVHRPFQYSCIFNGRAGARHRYSGVEMKIKLKDYGRETLVMQFVPQDDEDRFILRQMSKSRFMRLMNEDGETQVYEMRAGRLESSPELSRTESGLPARSAYQDEEPWEHA